MAVDNEFNMHSMVQCLTILTTGLSWYQPLWIALVGSPQPRPPILTAPWRRWSQSRTTTRIILWVRRRGMRVMLRRWSVDISSLNIINCQYQGTCSVPRPPQAPDALAEDGWAWEGAQHGDHHGTADISHQVGYVTSLLPRTLSASSLCSPGDVFMILNKSNIRDGRLKITVHYIIETPTDRVAVCLSIFQLCLLFILFWSVNRQFICTVDVVD